MFLPTDVSFIANKKCGVLLEVYTTPASSKAGDMQAPAQSTITEASAQAEVSCSTTKEPTPGSSVATTPATPQLSGGDIDTADERPSSSDSHIDISSSGSRTPDPDDDHGQPTPPLTVEKSAISGTSTPTPGSAGRVPSIVLSGNTVEERAANYAQGLRSPVVEDTLSDIEEAISEISNRRQSRTSQVMQNHNRRHSSMPSPKHRPDIRLEPPMESNDSGSEYSVQDPPPDVFDDSDEHDDDGQFSPGLPIQGFMDSGDLRYTKAEVAAWSPADVSQYLQSREIPQATCRKFEEQEVTGAILLELEMPMLKELELGSFGKRFEVWKEIEHLTKNLKPPTTKPRSESDTGRMSIVSFSHSAQRTRSNTVGTVLPRIQSQHNRPVSRQHRIDVHEANSHVSTPGDMLLTSTTIASSIASPTYSAFEQPRSPPISPGRLNSEHRLTFGHDQFSAATGLNAAMSAGAAVLSAGGNDGRIHQREGSFDRNWTTPATTTTTITGPPRPSTATGMREPPKPKHKPSQSGDTSFTADSGFSGSQPQTPNDRSYFSSGESTSRGRRVLQKKSSHARKGSYTEEQRIRSATSNSRHSRVPSAETAKLSGPPLSATAAYHISSKEKRKSASYGSAADFNISTPGSSTKGTSIQSSRATDDSTGALSSYPPPPPIPTNPNRRSFSEHLKSTFEDMSPSPTSAGARSVASAEESAPSLTNTTESGDKAPDRPPKADRALMAAGKRIRSVSSGNGLRQKSKKHTTAMMKGLKQTTPAEAAKDADYSGWMKKRGSTGVGAWKARFFVLNGRRLSYFYSNKDTRERGLIDITSHKVLPCTEDRLVGIHAALAAAASPTSSPKPLPSPLHQTLSSPKSPTSPAKDSEKPTSDKKDKEKKEKGDKKDKAAKAEKKAHKEEKDHGWFTFKLVPPAPGAAKGVTFTPPRLHYLATDSREDGKKWMAAIMKATIDRDETKPVVTSYSAKTISLQKAQELRTRPPELSRDEAAGLAISGLDLGLAEGEEADDEEGSGTAIASSRTDSGIGQAVSRRDSESVRSGPTTAPDIAQPQQTSENLKSSPEGFTQVQAIGVQVS